MANYSPVNFLFPTSPSDKIIRIRDKSGVIKYGIDPCSISSSVVFNNLMKVRIWNTDSIITLDFDTVSYAKQALSNFQDRVTLIKNNHPCPTASSPNIQRGPTVSSVGPSLISTFLSKSNVSSKVGSTSSTDCPVNPPEFQGGYSPDNFLVPTSVEDKTIQIRDKSGAVKYNVNPCTVVSSFVFSNLVKIRSLGTDFVLTLDFDTVADAKQALVEFQNRVNFIKSNHPCVEKSDCDCDGLIFYQLTASTAWSFEHTLGRTPSVSVYDYAGYEIEVLTRATINNVEVYSNTGITGSIYLI